MIKNYKLYFAIRIAMILFLNHIKSCKPPKFQHSTTFSPNKTLYDENERIKINIHCENFNIDLYQICKNNEWIGSQLGGNLPICGTSNTTTTTPTNTTTPTTTKTCSFKDEYNVVGNWTPVQLGEMSKVLCPQGKGYVFWKCMENGQFDENGTDFTQCNKWIENLSNITIESYKEAFHITNDILSNTTKKNSIVDFESMNKLMDTIDKLVNFTISINNNTDSKEVKKFSTQFMNTLSNVINQDFGWKNASSENKTKMASKILSHIESISFNVVSKQTDDYLVIRSENLYINTFNVNQSETLTFPINANPKNSTINFPNGFEVYDASINSNNGAVGATIDKLNEYLLGGITDNVKINSDILAFSISNKKQTVKLKNELVITIIHKESQQFGDEMRCVFWDTNTSSWSTEGCYKDEDQSDLLTTVCICNHLCNFAALVDYDGRQTNNPRKENLTYFLSGLSIVCLVLTLILIKMQKVKLIDEKGGEISENKLRRHTIGNLCISLIAVNLLVVIFMDKKSHKKLCHFVSFGLLYWLLASFFWSLLEGYQMMRNVLNHFKSFTNYVYIYYIGYISPIIAMAIGLTCTWITEDLFLDVFYDERYNHFCWIASTHYHHHIYLLIVPVALVMLLNAIFLGIIGRISFWGRNPLNLRLAENFVVSDKRKLSFFAISAVMGLTWLSFVLYIHHIWNFFSYLFIIMNGLQGVAIVLYQYFLNKQ